MVSRFTYAAVVGSGQRITGTLESRSAREAVLKLMELGYHPLSVAAAEDGDAAATAFRLGFGRRVKVTDLAVFTRQLASLLKAGLPMVQALGTLRKQSTHRQLQRIIQQIEQSLAQDARSLSEALRDYPAVFDPVYRGLVRAGEEGGKLVEVLYGLAKHLAQSAKLRGQVVGAFIYPIFLSVLGTLAIFVLMTFVIPRFQELFQSFGQNLPWPTVALIAVSSFLSKWWWAMLLGGVVFVVAAVTGLRRPAARVRFDGQLLRLPVFGQMLLKLEIARISRTLGALLDSGVRIIDALNITGGTVRNAALRSTFAGIGNGVSNGMALAETLEKAALFPPLMVNLVRTGEDSGELPEMLSELAEIYEDEAERAVTGTVKLLEPALIVFMGGIIAGIVSAVILPIFQANALAR